MNVKLTTVSAVALGLAAIPQARAQTMEAAPPPVGEERYMESHVAAPTKAFELSVGTGYTQGFGNLQSGVKMADVITPGIAVNLGLGYRIDPHWAVALVGQYEAFEPERSNSANGFTPGLALDYHFSPYTRVDPWLQIGTGYRMLWESHDASPTLMTHGFELAKLQLGVDLRAGKDVAIAPVIGGDLTLPLWQSVGGGNSVAIQDPRVSAFVFAGLLGRFDVTNTHETGYKRPPETITTTTITQAEVPPPPAPPPAAPPPEETKPVSPTISVSEEVLAACNMNLANIEKAPKFEFDKSLLLPSDYEVLDKIAECFTTGPLKGNEMLLVGRADPRGTVKYNDALGARRASSVASYLEQHGIAGSRMEQMTRGERDATGTNEATWAIDRRVDISVLRR